MYLLLSYKNMNVICYLQIGMQASAEVSVGLHVGDVVTVEVEEAHPRDDFLTLREVVEWE